MTEILSTKEKTIKLSDPGDVIAAVPHLLGFCPEDSLIFVGLHGNGLVQRSDMPFGDCEEVVVEHMVSNVVDSNETAVIALIVGDPVAHDRQQTPPYQRLARVVSAQLAEARIALAHVLWVRMIAANESWVCYTERDCYGTVPDPSTTELAAAKVAAGSVTFTSRSEIETLFKPDAPEIIERRAQLLCDALKNVEPESEEQRIGRGLGEIRLAIQQIDRGNFVLSNRQFTALTMALANNAVRDACLAITLPLDDKYSIAARQLWLTLIRTTPAPQRAEPATLYAFDAYQRGNGVLAGFSLANALAANPAHLLANLLSQALAQAISPERLSSLAKTSAYSLSLN